MSGIRFLVLPEQYYRLQLNNKYNSYLLIKIYKIVLNVYLVFALWYLPEYQQYKLINIY